MSDNLLTSLIAALAITVIVYALFVLFLFVSGRKQQARAFAGFIPDCLILFKRLLSDKRVSKSNKIIVGLTVAYLAMPIDLVPDFIPIAGQLDDAIIVALVLRRLVRQTDRSVIAELWTGQASTLDKVLKLVGNKQG